MNYKLSIQFSCAEIFYLNLNPVKSKYLVLRFDKQEINPEVTNSLTLFIQKKAFKIGGCDFYKCL